MRMLICSLGALLLLGQFHPALAEERPWRVDRLVDGLERPVFLTTAPGDDSRLFILEQHEGNIRIYDRDAARMHDTPFLTIGDLSRGNEQGLLGLAFHPNYAENGRFFINYTRRNGATRVEAYQVSTSDPDRADPKSARLVMTYEQPFSNHNGGWIAFGPDGNLYISAGDGGSGGDPGNRAQDITDQRLGKLLRVDVDRDDFPDDPNRNYGIPEDNPFVGRDGDDEIWAYGLRNVWRASFDRATNDLWMADVGQNRREEVNFQPADSEGGENYGWKVMEGFHCFDDDVPGAPPCGDESFVMPVHDYRHTGAPDGGQSITGGYVYRGSVEALAGEYLFADYVSEQIWGLRGVNGSGETTVRNLTDAFRPENGEIDRISSFGEDGSGEVYILDLGGEVFRIAPRN